VAKTFKAEAQRDNTNFRIKTISKPIKLNVQNSLLKEDGELKKLEVTSYEDGNDEENGDDDDFSDEEYEDEDLLPEDDEEVMTHCPDYCKCAGQYAAATTATYVSNRLYN